jgi:hypothetical protein
MEPKYVFKPGAQKVVEKTIYENETDPTLSGLESEPDSVTVEVGSGTTATFQINQSTGKVEVSYSNTAASQEYIADIAEFIVEDLQPLVVKKGGRRKSKHARKSKHKTRRR